MRTPILYDVDLWKQSGHWDKFRDNMYFTEVEGKQMGLKPMNCPAHIQIYKEERRSYRDLPIRYAEQGLVHRHEPSGTLHGLLRVRSITQDDGHIFCTEGQIEDEVLRCLDFGFHLYDLFGFEPRAELSTRPENRLGSDETWDHAENALAEAMRRRGLEYDIGEGEGTFYGPKIDLHITDAIGRSWQLGTVQLDYLMPERFELEYTGADNAEHRPVMIHRALLGSFERFIGILIEHYAGEFPLWLAPGAGADPADRRPALRLRARARRRCSRPRACASRSTSAPSRWARRSAMASCARRPTCCRGRQGGRGGPGVGPPPPRGDLGAMDLDQFADQARSKRLPKAPATPLYSAICGHLRTGRR